jgi:hypothetical protein
MKKLMLVVALVTCFLTVPASATLVNYTVGNWAGLPPTYAGDLWTGDTLTMDAYTGTLNLTPGSYDLKINTFDWIIDATSYNPTYFYPTAARSISIDGGPVDSLSQAGKLSCLPDDDYIDFYDGSAVNFTVQGYNVKVTPLGFSRAGAGPFTGLPWPQAESDVMARFEVSPVPEPGTLVLLSMAGLGLLTYTLRRRQS